MSSTLAWGCPELDCGDNGGGCVGWPGVTIAGCPRTMVVSVCTARLREGFVERARRIGS